MPVSTMGFFCNNMHMYQQLRSTDLKENRVSEKFRSGFYVFRELPKYTELFCMFANKHEK